MAPPRSGAYILISGQGLVLGRSHFWVLSRGDRRRRRRQTKPCKAFGTWWGFIQMPPHEASSSQINVISTNGDEISHTRDPFRRPDCHPPHQRWERKNTEIIKSRSGGSMAAHTNSAPATFRDVYLPPCSAPSTNNDGHLEHTTSPVSLLTIIVSSLHNAPCLKGALLLCVLFHIQ